MKGLLRLLQEWREAWRAEGASAFCPHSLLSTCYRTVTLICDGYWREWWIAFRATTPLVSS